MSQTKGRRTIPHHTVHRSARHFREHSDIRSGGVYPVLEDLTGMETVCTETAGSSIRAYLRRPPLRARIMTASPLPSHFHIHILTSPDSFKCTLVRSSTPLSLSLSLAHQRTTRSCPTRNSHQLVSENAPRCNSKRCGPSGTRSAKLSFIDHPFPYRLRIS